MIETNTELILDARIRSWEPEAIFRTVLICLEGQGEETWRVGVTEVNTVSSHNEWALTEVQTEGQIRGCEDSPAEATEKRVP